MTIIKVSSGYTPPENAYSGDGGTFVVTLVAITEPREVTGQYGTRMVQEWQFAIDDHDLAGNEQDNAGELVFNSWVTAPKDGYVSEKSTFYGYMTALFGGRKAPPNTEIDIETQLVGRQALATVERNGEGYVNILNLGAVPSAAKQAAKPKPKPAPAPLREQVGEDLDGLPF